jgi:hypothetical protein
MVGRLEPLGAGQRAHEPSGIVDQNRQVLGANPVRLLQVLEADEGYALRVGAARQAALLLFGGHAPMLHERDAGCTIDILARPGGAFRFEGVPFRRV